MAGPRRNLSQRVVAIGGKADRTSAGCRAVGGESTPVEDGTALGTVAVPGAAMTLSPPRAEAMVAAELKRREAERKLCLEGVA